MRYAGLISSSSFIKWPLDLACWPLKQACRNHEDALLVTQRDPRGGLRTKRTRTPSASAITRADRCGHAAFAHTGRVTRSLAALPGSISGGECLLELKQQVGTDEQVLDSSAENPDRGTRCRGRSVTFSYFSFASSALS